MKTFFTVSDLNFLDDGTDDSLSFIPTADIKNKFSDKDLLRRIFTENIEVIPEPPTYSDIVQDIMKENPQTAEQVDWIIKGYPYEKISAAYDYCYKMWTKIGTGEIFRENESYYSDGQAGLQLQNILPTLSAIGVKINFSLETYAYAPYIETLPIITIYNSLITTSTSHPRILISCTTSQNGKYTIKTTYKKTSTSTAITSESLIFNIDETNIINLLLEISPTQNTIKLFNIDESTTSPITEINSSLINFNNIRLLATSAENAIFNSLQKLLKFQLYNEANQILSSFNKT